MKYLIACDSRGLPPEEMQALNEKKLAGDPEARLTMFLANQGLIPEMVEVYFSDTHSPDYPDAISWGMSGLLEAVDEFDHTRGKEFAALACSRILKYVRRFRTCFTRTVRLPWNIHQDISTVRRVTLALKQELGREPSKEEIAWKCGMMLAKVKALLGLVMEAESIDAPYDKGGEGEGGESWHSFYADGNTPTPLDVAGVTSEGLYAAQQLLELRLYISQRYHARDQEMFYSHFGLFGRERRSVDDIGDMFDVSGNAVTLVYTKILRGRAKCGLQLKNRVDVFTAMCRVAAAQEVYAGSGREMPRGLIAVGYIDTDNLGPLTNK